ncbi:hypothetical protein D1BOALGB6SA_2042 [Olavius sp. associated proteobacterium Delta 1]|nr:hypothetical protein D1BOALGB6SA_2042 [Olavius sp. associated proteobacterium Delta 1]
MQKSEISPSADDYLIDADHSTLRLSTGYPSLKKSSPGQTGELGPNLPESSIPRQKTMLTIWSTFVIWMVVGAV